MRSERRGAAAGAPRAGRVGNDAEADDTDNAGMKALFDRVKSGDVEARNALFEEVSDALRAAARLEMNRQPRGHTLQPTDLVHEVYLRFSRSRPSWIDRAHVVRAAARMMRSILVDHARRKLRRARLLGGRRLLLDDVLLSCERSGIDVVALHEALERLGHVDPRAARIVEMRYFGGQPPEVVARALGMSRRTVEREWLRARAWLRAEIG